MERPKLGHLAYALRMVVAVERCILIQTTKHPRRVMAIFANPDISISDSP